MTFYNHSNIIHTQKGSRNSAVVVVTRIRTGYLRKLGTICVSSERYFSSLKRVCVQIGCAAGKTSQHVATGDLYPKVSRSVREADQSPSPSARFKTEDINPLPINFMLFTGSNWP